MSDQRAAEELARELEYELWGPSGSGQYNVHNRIMPHINAAIQQAVSDALRAPRELTFAEFSRINRLRCESPTGFNHQLSSWSTSDWFTALLGELGEAANIAKKLNRERDNVRGNTESAEALRVKLRQEIGDTFVYLDLLSQSLGFQIGDAAQEVFASKSKQIGYVEAALSPEPPMNALVEGFDPDIVNRPYDKLNDPETWNGIGAEPGAAQDKLLLEKELAIIEHIKSNVSDGCVCGVCKAVRDEFPSADAALREHDDRVRDELIARHRCGCEVCAHSSTLCPASASSIAMEPLSRERAEREIRLDEHQKSCQLCQTRIEGNRIHFQCKRGAELVAELSAAGEEEKG